MTYGYGGRRRLVERRMHAAANLAQRLGLTVLALLPSPGLLRVTYRITVQGPAVAVAAWTLAAATCIDIPIDRVAEAIAVLRATSIERARVARTSSKEQ